MVQPHSVADNVRLAMRHKRKTQSDLAEVLGFTRQAVSRRLTGQTDFSVTELQKLAEFLDVPPADLLDVAGIRPMSTA